jgi:hypothetical protein
MKREITCLDCAKQWREISITRSLEEMGERVDVLEGTARRSMLCDGCNMPLPRGQKCAAVSVTTPRQRPYPYWAPDYIEVES